MKVKTDINFIFCTLQFIQYASIRKTEFSSCSSRIKIKGMFRLRVRSSVNQHLPQLPDFQEIQCRNYLKNFVEQVCVLWKMVRILQWVHEFLLLLSIFLGRHGWKSVQIISTPCHSVNVSFLKISTVKAIFYLGTQWNPLFSLIVQYG